MGRRTTPSGLTLIELLIVIAIIAVLVQLALPAIEDSREAARRTACQNNLHQIGLAMLHHESALRQLPTAGWGWAWIGDPDRGTGESQPGSWAYQLLPYMDEQSVYDISRGASDETKYETLTTLAATPVPTFYCPSRRLPRATPTVDPEIELEELAPEMFWYNAKKANKLVRTDYKANVGDTFVFWSEGPPPSKAERGEGFLKFKLRSEYVTLDAITGVVVQREAFRFSQITDGLSKTYFGGEKFLPSDEYKKGTNPTDDQSCWNGDDMDMVASTNYIPRPDTPTTVQMEGLVGIPFGSAHPDGLNMVFCDGSVQFVAFEIDPEVHRRNGNRHDSSQREATNFQ